MLSERFESIHRTLIVAAADCFGVDPPEVPLQYPPDSTLGDLAIPIGFRLAKQLRRSPASITSELAEKVGAIDGVASLVATGGFLNIRLDRPQTIDALRSDLDAGWRPSPPLPRKVIVEHTNINPNKAAHIGHLRNAVLGDTLVRLLRYLGHRVEAQNYIDDTGVQVADVVYALELHGEIEEERLGSLIDSSSPRFDDFCWDRYAEVALLFDAEPERKQERKRILRALEEEEQPLARQAAKLATAIVNCHLSTMERIGVQYDLLPRERDILKLRFFERAMERLKETGAVYLAKEGKNKGCLVLKFRERADGHQDPDKILVRSDGTATYVAKDIAYQLWKMGLLGLDFGYEPFHTYGDGHILWTTRGGTEESAAPRFGNASRVYNVIDARQSYLQRVVKEGLLAMGHEKQAREAIHFAYEMVALSPACAMSMGISVSPEEQGKSFIEMSGRRGLGVKAEELLDLLEEQALARVAEANPDLSEAEQRHLAVQVSRAALRYSMLRQGRTKIIAFDFDEALSFEGDSGPYLLYAAVRISSIFRKLQEQGSAPEDSAAGADIFEAIDEQEQEDSWKLVMLASRLPEIAKGAAESLDLSTLARYAYDLAGSFSTYYHRYHILHEKDAGKQSARMAIAAIVRGRLCETLAIMGMNVPDRM